ncbi:MAG: NADH-quinone oxidoreductase subunit K [Pseudomonadota bacterium]
MEWVFAVVAGALATAGVWLMLSRHLLSVVFGVALLGSAANVVVFASGRVVDGAPPLAPEGAAAPLPWAANALPQALVLTAIVIGFGLAAFALALALAAHRRLQTVDPEEMRVAEPRRPDEVGS